VDDEGSAPPLGTGSCDPLGRSTCPTSRACHTSRCDIVPRSPVTYLARCPAYSTENRPVAQFSWICPIHQSSLHCLRSKHSTRNDLRALTETTRSTALGAGGFSRVSSSARSARGSSSCHRGGEFLGGRSSTGLLRSPAPNSLHRERFKVGHRGLCGGVRGDRNGSRSAPDLIESGVSGLLSEPGRADEWIKTVETLTDASTAERLGHGAIEA
jgi:hypothetical protein